MAIDVQPGAGRIQPVSGGPDSARPWWMKPAVHTGLIGAVAGYLFGHWLGSFLMSFNPNAPEVSNSAYLVKNRINASLAFDKAFFRNYKTRFGLFYEGRTGKPYSWTYSNDANGDGIFGNDLLYVPRAPGSGDVIFLGDTSTNNATETRFWQIINDNGLGKYAGRTVERNSAFSPWTNNVDLRLSQDVPSFFKGHKAVFTFDILNFGNLLNHSWGVGQRIVTTSPLTNPAADAQGRLAGFQVIENFQDLLHHIIAHVSVPSGAGTSCPAAAQRRGAVTGQTTCHS